MQITIWGNELLAWTSAPALAESGNDVTIVAHTQQEETEAEFKVSNEPELEQLIQKELKSGRLTISTEQEGISHATNHILALNPDQYATAETLVNRLKDKYASNLLIINQSNFGVGSSDQLQNHLNLDDNQVITYIPDMLSEGSALKDYKSPETIIAGCSSEWAMVNIRALLRPFCQTLKQWLTMTPTEAEFTKFANTGMLALRLGYINELANLADQLNVDIEVIRQGMISDPRIGPHYLNPGCGFGGLHFQQYIEGLSALMSEARNSKLLDTVLIENEKQKEHPFRKLWRYYACDLQGKTISLWGLSFKPGTASIDNAPSLKVISSLLAQGCKVQVHDPEAMDNIKEHFSKEEGISFFNNRYDALQSSDALLLLTEWPEYWSPEYKDMLKRMHHPLIIDGRNIFEKELLESLGFTYYGVGR